MRSSDSYQPSSLGIRPADKGAKTNTGVAPSSARSPAAPSAPGDGRRRGRGRGRASWTRAGRRRCGHLPAQRASLSLPSPPGLCCLQPVPFSPPPRNLGSLLPCPPKSRTREQASGSDTPQSRSPDPRRPYRVRAGCCPLQAELEVLRRSRWPCACESGGGCGCGSGCACGCGCGCGCGCECGYG